ncbi:UTRA domain-containing protein [Streptomyces canus]|uniref:UTRA domain-containing protein n=1 Tax=Streptomyces canus TaxID=58343 RepID=UPI003F4D5239
MNESAAVCVRTSYEFRADTQPAQLSVSWEPVPITEITPIPLPETGPLAGKGVVERMRSIGIDIVTALEVPRPARATPEHANLLGINRGDLVLAIERTYYDGDGRAVETADITISDARWEAAYETAVNASALGAEHVGVGDVDEGLRPGRRGSAR